MAAVITMTSAQRWGTRTWLIKVVTRVCSDMTETTAACGQGASEPVRIQDLRRQPAVERVGVTEHRVVQPVVDIDEIEIVSRSDDPAKARLPADDRALCVVLHIVDE